MSEVKHTITDNEQKSASRWEKGFLKLQEYEFLTGDCDVNAEEYPKLAAFLASQCQQFQRGTLPKDHQEKLEGLGVQFDEKKSVKAEYSDSKWNQNYQKLVSYHKKNGHSDCPSSGQHQALGCWVQRQRHLNRRNELQPDRKALLDDIGLSWEVKGESSWKEMFWELKSFYEDKGHHRVHSNTNRRLRSWLNNQCRMFKSNKLNPEHETLLRSINFPFVELHACIQKEATEPSSGGDKGADESTWKDIFIQLKAFYKEHGHYIIPRSSHKKLQNWTNTQRRNFRARKLRAEREELLNSIDFPFNPSSKSTGTKDGEAKMQGTKAGGSIFGKRLAGEVSGSEENGDQATSSRAKWPRLAKSKVASYSHKHSVKPPPGEDSSRKSKDKGGKEEATQAAASTKVPTTNQCVVLPPSKAPSGHQSAGPSVCCAKQRIGAPPIIHSSVQGPKVDAYSLLMPLVVDLKYLANESQLLDCAEILELMLKRQQKKGQACLQLGGGISAHSRLMSLIMDMDEFVSHSTEGGALVYKCEMFLKQHLERAKHNS